MEQPILLDIQKILSAEYFTYFKHDNILVVAEDKTVLPFAYLIIDEHYPDEVLLSLSINYSNSINVAQCIINISNMYKVLLSDVFYISSDGRTYFNEEAYDRWDIDLINLDKIEPLNKHVH